MAKTDMEKAAKRILKGYGEDVQRNLDTITKRMGRAGARALRKKSQETLKGTGEYARGWTYAHRKTRRYSKTTIYNEHYSLPHLLEHGHVTRNGTGRTFADTPGHEHIRPVEEDVVKTYQKEVLDKL